MHVVHDKPIRIITIDDRRKLATIGISVKTVNSCVNYSIINAD